MRTSDFIEVYDDVLDPGLCAALIQRFNTSGHARRGATGGGVDVALKDSWDIALDEQPAWADIKRKLNDAVVGGIKRYLRRYVYTVIAPLQLKLPDPTTGNHKALDADGFAALDDSALSMVMSQVFRPGSINLQKYIADQGGYPYWHSEQYPKLDMGEALHRVLLWTVYLNDDFGAGETEFLYQGRLIKPKTGSLLLAPAAFTHTHRGNRPLGGDKYIATSWVLFQRAETIYGVPRR